MQALRLAAADDGERLRGALASGPDALVIDIEASEDAVSMARREGAAAFLRDAAMGGRPRPRVFVRVSPFATGRTEAELEAVMPGAPDGIMLPCAVGRPAVERLAARLAVLEALHGIADGRTEIIASVEDAAGALAVASLAGAGRRLAALAWDDARLRRDLGLSTGGGCLPDPCRHLRAMTVLTARAAGVPAIDSPCPEGSEFDLFAAEVGRAKRDGFSAKLVLTEAQAAAVRGVSSP